MSSKFRDCIEARKYMLNVLADMINNELHEFADGGEGWTFGGVDDTFD